MMSRATWNISFKVFLIPKIHEHSKSSDLAVEFISFDKLKPEEMEQYARLVALIKPKEVTIANLVMRLMFKSDLLLKSVILNKTFYVTGGVGLEPITVFTIGYEELSIDEFLGRLKKHRITTLIDVREIPYSRKRDFSKTRLAEHLQSAGVKYIHVGKLGSPKPLREKLHKDKNYDSFFEGYRTYLETLNGDMKELYEKVVVNNTTCLMCMERDPLKCHRIVVAKKMKEIDGNGMFITHI